MTVLGVNLKAYFGPAETVVWCTRVASLLADHPAVTSGDVRIFVLPSAPLIPAAQEVLNPVGIAVGAQNLYPEAGAYTGELSPALLAELGCEFVAVGHAERRRLFGETDDDVAAKVAAAVAHGLTPVVCVGEPSPGTPAGAAAHCAGELQRALSRVQETDAEIVVAYEPIWAIGAAEPAGAAHVNAVCSELRAMTTAKVIYGGTAGPGLCSELAGAVDGLFLGRRVHDPAALLAVVEEVSAAKEASEA